MRFTSWPGLMKPMERDGASSSASMRLPSGTITATVLPAVMLWPDMTGRAATRPETGAVTNCDRRDSASAVRCSNEASAVCASDCAASRLVRD